MYNYEKDGVTVMTVLDNRREKKGGVYPIKVRVTYKRDRKYYQTGKAMTAEEWEILPINKTRAAGQLRNDIENSFTIVKEKVQELLHKQEFSFDTLNRRLSKSSDNTINALFAFKIKELTEEERTGTMLWYDNTLKGIERFSTSKLPVIAVNQEWLRKYERFLLAEGKKTTSVSMHLRAIRSIMNDAKTLGIISDAQYPFGKGKFEIQEGEGRKIALSKDAIKKIAQFTDGREATERYRDLWLFIYLCNGINVIDLIQLKYSNIVEDEITYIRQKTARTTKKVKGITATIVPQMQAIIERWGNEPQPENYIFPFLTGGESPSIIKKKAQDVTRRINKHMKKIGEHLEIGSISTYTARHSFATVLKRSGANIAFISESLGHSDLKTTENYLASFEKKERQKNAQLLTDFLE